MAKKPRIGVIGTGGTISSLGDHVLDSLNYGDTGNRLEADQLLARFPECQMVADAIPIRYAAIPSTAIGPKEWLELVGVIHKAVRDDPTLDGIVVTHGTASLEETAYFLNLTLKTEVPVVVVGSQRPPTALGTDAGSNLVDGIRTAGSPESRGKGVMVVLNDEIQAAREVTKTSTYRLQTFRSPDFGCLGHVDTDGVHYYRAPIRKHTLATEFDVAGMTELPRVDIVLSYGGMDSVVIDAVVAAGAEGIISSGFAPGMTTPAEAAALQKAVESGIVVVQSTRAGSGRIAPRNYLRKHGMLAADSLNPQKARILLMLGLAKTKDAAELARMFTQY